MSCPSPTFDETIFSSGASRITVPGKLIEMVQYYKDSACWIFFLQNRAVKQTDALLAWSSMNGLHKESGHGLLCTRVMDLHPSITFSCPSMAIVFDTGMKYPAGWWIRISRVRIKIGAFLSATYPYPHPLNPYLLRRICVSNASGIVGNNVYIYLE